MFDNIINFFKKFSKETRKESKDMAKERLHLVLMQDRANVSADFLEMMKQEIIEVIKKYIDVDENSIDVKLTNKVNSDGTTGAPALYANIPIVSLKDETKKININRKKENKEANKEEEVKAEVLEETENNEEQKEEEKETIETKIQNEEITEGETEEIIAEDVENKTTEISEKNKENEVEEVIESLENKEIKEEPKSEEVEKTEVK